MTTPKTKPVPTVAMVERAEAFAKYHDEHAKYGGLSREFHERAASFLRSTIQALADIDAEAYARGRTDEREACASVAEEAFTEWDGDGKTTALVAFHIRCRTDGWLESLRKKP